MAQNSDLCRRGWSLRILNQLFEATHKIFVPHKVIRSQRVFINSTLVVVGGPPYSPGAIPVDHFMGFFLGRITLVCFGSGKGAELGDSGEVGVAAHSTQTWLTSAIFLVMAMQCYDIAMKRGKDTRSGGVVNCVSVMVTHTTCHTMLAKYLSHFLFYLFEIE